MVLFDAGRAEEAAELLEEAVASHERNGRDTETHAQALRNLAHVLSHLGHHEEARARAVRSLELYTELFAADDVDVALARRTLAELEARAR